MDLVEYQSTVVVGSKITDDIQDCVNIEECSLSCSSFCIIKTILLTAFGSQNVYNFNPVKIYHYAAACAARNIFKLIRL